jgi:hypothetical protein
MSKKVTNVTDGTAVSVFFTLEMETTFDTEWYLKLGDVMQFLLS